MTQADRLQAVAAGATTGLLGGLLGVGGGMVLIPLLTERFGFTQHQAHGTSLAVIGATALASLVVYGAASHVDWAVALPVALASVVTAPLGARLASRISPLGLRRGFAVLLALVGMRMLWQPWAPGPSLFGHGLAALPFDLVLGAAVGLLAGFMGVGGGSLAVPAMTLLLGMSQPTAQGTSLAVILVTAPAGAFEHHRQGNVVWRWVPMLALGAALGAPLASWLAQRLPVEVLVRTFALFVLISAALMWVRSRPPVAR